MMSDLHLAYLLAAVAALLWGLVVIPIKHARTSGRLGIAISMATGTIAMFVLSGDNILKLVTLSYQELALYIATGTVQFALGCGAYYLAVQRGSLSVAVPITRVKILLVFFLSIVLGLEVFRWTLLGAAMLVFLGGLMVGKPFKLSSGGERDGHWVSIAFAIAACTFWAVGETLMGMLPARIPPITSNMMMLGCGLLSWMVIALITGWWRELLDMPGRDIWCFMAHGIISFSAAYALFVWAIQLAGPPRVVIITSTYPLISTLVGWFAYQERYSLRLAIGAVLIVVGVITLQFV